jgi:type II secretion system protein N
MSQKPRSSRFRLRLKKSQARLLRLLGYPIFAFSVFLLSLYVSLPLDRIKERLERELSQEPGPPPPGSGGLGIGIGMDVVIGELDLHVLPIGASARDITLRPRTKPGVVETEGEKAAKPKPMFIDDVTVHLPMSMLLGSELALNLDVQALGGTLSSFGAVGAESGAVMRLDLARLGLTRAPILNQFLPLPVVGVLSGLIDVKVPPRKPTVIGGREPPKRPSNAPPPLDYSKATGLIEVKLAQGVLGDGKAKLTVPGDAFLSQGLTFPRISLGDFSGRVVIDRGRATLADVHTKSDDAEIWIEGYIDLRDPVQTSEMRLYLRFQPSQTLIKREPTIEILNNAMSAGKRSDGSLGFAITGSFSSPRSRPSKEPPEGISRPGSLGQVGKDVGPSLKPGSPPSPGVAPPSVPSTVIAPSPAPYVPTPLPPPPPPASSPPPPVAAPPPTPPPVMTPPPIQLPSSTPPEPPPPQPSPAAAPLPPASGTGHMGGAMGSGQVQPAPPPHQPEGTTDRPEGRPEGSEGAPIIPESQRPR